jgi:hypothetical protein
LNTQPLTSLQRRKRRESGILGARHGSGFHHFYPWPDLTARGAGNEVFLLPKKRKRE